MKRIILIHKKANTVPFVLLFGIYASLAYEPLGTSFFGGYKRRMVYSKTYPLYF